ncbi:MAG: RidA family protein [Proteobacteria bacterium]|nr:RidA family protein [Pseudomonadota bacterium]
MAIKTVVTESGKFAYDRFHFAQATVSNGLLLCSGVIGTGADRKIPSDIKEEFRNAWQSISQVLKEAGLGLEDIVECTTYHVGLQAHMADFMAVRDEFLKEPWPAWTAIGITELAAPGAHVEIRVIAQMS